MVLCYEVIFCFGFSQEFYTYLNGIVLCFWVIENVMG